MRRVFWHGIAGLALLVGACAGALGETVVLLATLFVAVGAYWMGERMPKRAIIRRTNSVKGGPRSQGGGTRRNGWNCGVMVFYGPAAAGLLAAAWEVFSRAAA